MVGAVHPSFTPYQISTMTVTASPVKKNVADYAPASQTYDVVIMGAGWAGVCQARHLLLNTPGISIAIIDPRPPERTVKDMKIGESAYAPQSGTGKRIFMSCIWSGK